MIDRQKLKQIVTARSLPNYAMYVMGAFLVGAMIVAIVMSMRATSRKNELQKLRRDLKNKYTANNLIDKNDTCFLKDEAAYEKQLGDDGYTLGGDKTEKTCFLNSQGEYETKLENDGYSLGGGACFIETEDEYDEKVKGLGACYDKTKADYEKRVKNAGLINEADCGHDPTKCNYAGYIKEGECKHDESKCDLSEYTKTTDIPKCNTKARENKGLRIVIGVSSAIIVFLIFLVMQKCKSTTEPPPLEPPRRKMIIGAATLDAKETGKTGPTARAMRQDVFKRDYEAGKLPSALLELIPPPLERQERSRSLPLISSGSSTGVTHI